MIQFEEFEKVVFKSSKFSQKIVSLTELNNLILIFFESNFYFQSSYVKRFFEYEEPSARDIFEKIASDDIYIHFNWDGKAGKSPMNKYLTFTQICFSKSFFFVVVKC